MEGEGGEEVLGGSGWVCSSLFSTPGALPCAIGCSKYPKMVMTGSHWLLMTMTLHWETQGKSLGAGGLG